eukprot:4711005-Prymnesium_polylepis.1
MQIADCVRPRQLTTSHPWHVAGVTARNTHTRHNNHPTIMFEKLRKFRGRAVCAQAENIFLLATQIHCRLCPGARRRIL